MTFLFPSVLWLLSLILIPILIHLFSFKKKKTFFFSNLTFLKKIEHKNKSIRNFKNIVLLVLRCLIFSSLIIAFAQPISNNKKSNKEELNIIFIDNSFSMSKQGIEGELLSQSKEKAKKLINNSKHGNKFKIITNENKLSYPSLNKNEAIDYIDEITYEPIPRKIATIINSFDKKEKIINHFYLFSDFQKNTSNLEEINPDSSIYISAIKLSPNNSNNIYIDSIWFTKPFHLSQENQELNIKIKNSINEDLKNIELSIKLKKLNRKLYINLPKKKSKIISLKYVETEKEFNQGTIIINDENCTFDNNYYLSYRITKKSPILIINGEDFSSNIKKVYELENLYSEKEINIRNFTTNHIHENDLIILNGISNINSISIKNLKEFIKLDKTLLIFPGKIKDYQSWNIFLRQIGLPSFIKTNEVGNLIESINYSDEFFKPVFEKNPKKMNISSIIKSYKIRDNKNYIPLINLKNKTPLYLKTFNKNIYLFTSTLNEEYSTFSSNALFSSILLRTAEMSIKSHNLEYRLGENSLLKLLKRTDNEFPIHLTNENIDFIPPYQYKDQSIYIDFKSSSVPKSILPGNYSISQGNSKLTDISINNSRKESIIDYYSINELESQLSQFKNDKTKFVNIDSSTFELQIKKHNEYWKQFIFFALTLIIIEMLFIKYWNSRFNKSKNI